MCSQILNGNSEFAALVKREEIPYKFMLISLSFPIYKMCIYTATQDIVALYTAIILSIMWIIMFYSFVETFNDSEDLMEISAKRKAEQ